MAERRHSVLSAVILFAAAGALAVGTVVFGTDAPFWRPFLRMHDETVLALGGDSIGNVYVTPERLLQRSADYRADIAEEHAALLCDMAAAADAPVYLMAVPTSVGIYADTLPEGAPYPEEHAALRDFREQLDDSIVWIEAERWLTEAREQYIYYRNDPKWTSYGAYCVYKSAIRKLGFTALGYDSFVITHERSDFYGTLAQESRYFGEEPDMIDLYTPAVKAPEYTVTAIHADGSPVQLPSYFLTDADEDAPEDVYALMQEPVLRIESEISGGRSLLLVTDGFGANMLPFLMLHYREITAVHWPDATARGQTEVPPGEYDQILVLLGADTLCAPQESCREIVISDACR